MRTVEVLLRDDVENLGVCGEVVKVAAGYARNYLLPQRLAVQATAENMKMMERRAHRLAAKRAAVEADTRRKVDELSKVKLATKEKADENGHLFGSVSAAGVARLLAEAGYPCEERHVRLEQPIKEVGTYQVPIHVHGDATADVELVVEATA